jgi:small-conductance mechanosensitive channel
MIESVRQLVGVYLQLEPALQARLLSSLLIILALWLLSVVARRFVYRRFQADPRALYSWRKVTEYLFVILGIFLVGRIWLAGIQSLATYLGLLSAGLAIALQDLIVNLAGWAFVIWRRPFVVGDRIEIGEHAGDVIDIRLFEFSLLEIGNRIEAEQSTGRIIHVPNGKIFTEALINFSQGLPYIWNEIPVLITFESNWQKAKALLTAILHEHAPDVGEEAREYVRRVGGRFVISYTNVDPTVYTRVAASGVLLTLRYMIDPRQRRNSEQLIWEAILRAFATHWDVEFAYETQREFDHWRERKRPPAETAESARGQEEVGETASGE